MTTLDEDVMNVWPWTGDQVPVDLLKMNTNGDEARALQNKAADIVTTLCRSLLVGTAVGNNAEQKKGNGKGEVITDLSTFGQLWRRSQSSTPRVACCRGELSARSWPLCPPPAA